MERMMNDIEGWYENHPSLEYDRRDLSGVYIFDKFPEETIAHPTCFEDCTTMKQEEYIKSISLEELRRLTLILSRSLKDVGRDLNIEGSPSEKDNTDEDNDEIPQG